MLVQYQSTGKSTQKSLVIDVEDANRGETSVDKLSCHNLMEPVQDLNNDQPSINPSIRDSSAYGTPYPVEESDSDGMYFFV